MICPQDGAPVISWFINPINYSYLVRYIYHKPQLSHLCLNLAWLVVGTPTPLKNDGVRQLG